MARIRLIHWKPAECPERASRVEHFGHEVEASPFDTSIARALRASPPDAILIDLSRLPAHGLEAGVYLRRAVPTRHVPLIFVEGEPAKVERVKEKLPDARYTSYDRLELVLEDVLAAPPREVVVPKTPGIATSAPLAKKLGLKDGGELGLYGAPKRFDALVPGFRCHDRPPSGRFLSIWFVHTLADLTAVLPSITLHAASAGAWIAWPKTTRTFRSEVNGNLVRERALAAGLVDFKICSIDGTWSAMRFARKRD